MNTFGKKIPLAEFSQNYQRRIQLRSDKVSDFYVHTSRLIGATSKDLAIEHVPVRFESLNFPVRNAAQEIKPTGQTNSTLSAFQ